MLDWTAITLAAIAAIQAIATGVLIYRAKRAEILAQREAARVAQEAAEARRLADAQAAEAAAALERRLAAERELREAAAALERQRRELAEQEERARRHLEDDVARLRARCTECEGEIAHLQRAVGVVQQQLFTERTAAQTQIFDLDLQIRRQQVELEELRRQLSEREAELGELRREGDGAPA